MPGDPTIHFEFGEAGDGRSVIRYENGDSERLMLAEVGPGLSRLEESSFAGDAVRRHYSSGQKRQRRTEISGDCRAVSTRDSNMGSFSRRLRDRSHPATSCYRYGGGGNVGAGVRRGLDDPCPRKHREDYFRRNGRLNTVFLRGSDQRRIALSIGSPRIRKSQHLW